MLTKASLWFGMSTSVFHNYLGIALNLSKSNKIDWAECFAVSIDVTSKPRSLTWKKFEGEGCISAVERTWKRSSVWVSCFVSLMEEFDVEHHIYLALKRFVKSTFLSHKFCIHERSWRALFNRLSEMCSHTKVHTRNNQLFCYLERFWETKIVGSVFTWKGGG